MVANSCADGSLNGCALFSDSPAGLGAIDYAWLDSKPSHSTLADSILADPCVPAAPPKTLILIGGGWQFPETRDPYGVSIYLDILNRAGGVEGAKIGIFTTASSSGTQAEANGELYRQDFRDLYELYLAEQFPDTEIDVEWIPFHIDNYEEQRDNPALIEQINSRNAFIFGGGDQSFITESFFIEDAEAGIRTETPVFQALRDRYEAGAIVAGTSAGTAVQTRSPMITEGESYEALIRGSTPLIGSPPFVRDLFYNPLGGLGFFNYGLLDSHFSERGRQGRIVRLASDIGETMTYGVDENTALIVTNADTPEVSMEVLGENGVFIADLSHAAIDENFDHSGYWAATGIRATYLTEGDRFDPLTKMVLFGDKLPIDGTEPVTPTTDNVFSWRDPETRRWTDPRAFTELAIDLFKSESPFAIGSSFETEPMQYSVILNKTDLSKGFSGVDSVGAERNSFANLDMTIAPIV
jgi:cyanophycinase